MFNYKFGIEIEFTGITRNVASTVVKKYLGGTTPSAENTRHTRRITAPDGRIWQIARDGSIECQKIKNGLKIAADNTYSVELVSPILTYDADIVSLQGLVRKLRERGAFANDSCGIHIHLDGAGHDVRSIRNFLNIIASRNDLFYKALQIKPDRIRYCKKLDASLIKAIKYSNPTTLKRIEELWYEGERNHSGHYHASRYHFLNLHSFFTGTHTIELRGFNSTLHAGKIRSYIVFALALDNQAITQKNASSRKPQSENEKFAMRTYLNRIGLIGPEFANCRKHLTAHLDGSAAWRYRQ